ncbi:peptidase S41 [Asaia sp. SF2.1]|nr:peptidase S41 [Asaia sp. SF2.1]
MRKARNCLLLSVFSLTPILAWAHPAHWALFDPQRQFNQSYGPVCTDQKRALSLQSKTAKDDQYGAIEASFPLHGIQARAIRLSASLTTDTEHGKAALWLSVHEGNRQIFFRRAQVVGPISNKPVEIALVIPSAATMLSYGITLEGTGEVHACEFRLDSATFSAHMTDTSMPLKTMIAAINAIHGAALNSELIDWMEQTNALRQVAVMGSSTDVYAEIRRLLGDLRDGHSFVFEPSQKRAREDHEVEVPALEEVSPRIGIIKMPGLVTASSLAQQAYARAGNVAFARVPTASGWIVDLRQDHGGNMWPMLQALYPLFGKDTLGYFEDRTGRRSEAWRAVDRKPLTDTASGPDLSQIPVAVLVGHGTASAGEAVAIAFKGRPHTRLFGQATYGQTNANRTFMLPDGGMLLVASSFELDRHGTRYRGPLQPDILTADPRAFPTVAIDWLQAESQNAGK